MKIEFLPYSITIFMIIFIVHSNISWASVIPDENIEKLNEVAEELVDQTEKMLQQSPYNDDQIDAQTSSSLSLRDGGKKKSYWQMFISEEYSYLKYLQKLAKDSIEKANNTLLESQTDFVAKEMSSMIKFINFLYDLISNNDDDNDNSDAAIEKLGDIIHELTENARMDINFLMNINRNDQANQINHRCNWLENKYNELHRTRFTEDPRHIFAKIKTLFIKIAEFEHFVLDSRKRNSLDYSRAEFFKY